MRKTLLILPLLFWVGCAIQPSEGVAKPINYSVPPVARFNVPLLLKLNINEIEEVLIMSFSFHPIPLGGG